MICQEYETVCKYLKEREIQLSSSNDWLKSCIDMFKNSVQTKSSYRSLNEYVCIQWLLADLQDVQHSVLPTNCLPGKTELTGKYCVQINWMRDIGQSCYSQLQAAQNIKESESNDFVSADESKKQAWEPKPKRVLMMEITDGVTVFKAMEYSPIAKLDDNFLPGTKICLSGPIECRNGILFLEESNISFLGGEVESFHENNSKENLLSRCLNIPVSISVDPQPPQERWANTVGSSSARRTGVPTTNPEQIIGSPQIVNNRIGSWSNFESPTLSQNEQLPDSTSTVEHNTIVRDRGMLMTDEDDEFLNQLPDEILHDTKSNNSVPSSFDSTLNEIPVTNNSKQTYNDMARGESSSLESCFNHSKVLSKPKSRLFPSIKYLNSNEKEQSLPNNFLLLTKSREQTLQTLVEPETSFKSNNEDVLDETCPSSTSALPLNNHEETVQSIKSVDSGEKNVINMEFPVHEQVLIKVEYLTKIKIKNSQWQCSANVLVKDKSLNVIFSNKVCEIIFGISAFKLEKFRSEMANDHTLRNKVNGILKAGQAKLKSLNCLVTLEYSSEDCTPEVVSIDEV